MPTESMKTCRECGRVGTQRFVRANARGKATYICADEGACDKRVAEVSARQIKARTNGHTNGNGKVHTNGHSKRRATAGAR